MTTRNKGIMGEIFEAHDKAMGRIFEGPDSIMGQIFGSELPPVQPVTPPKPIVIRLSNEKLGQLARNGKLEYRAQGQTIRVVWE